ncbi:MAG TPA: TIGR00730 family Rossman fold protein [Actinomycetes bacterium]|nr:TIGR00730 family Rossman fold protein [Actinomycetes bacterium]
MRSVCVFSGSSFGRDPVYAEAARALALELVGRRLRLVYGGASVGLMGVLADTVLASGGEVVGVIPQHLVDKEIAHPGLSDLRITGSMHERKMLMADLADGFVALPGGFGTLEEFAEVVTWTQLGLQHKPCGLLDVGGYYARLLAFVDHATDEGFVPVAHRRLVLSDDDPGRLLNALDAWVPPATDKWSGDRGELPSSRAAATSGPGPGRPDGR